MEKRETLIEFLDKVFAEKRERISREEKESIVENIKSGVTSENSIEELRRDINKTTLTKDWIEKNITNLLALEEFRFTKKINVIPLPAYLTKVSDETLSPCNEESKENTKPVTSVTYILNAFSDTHYFPKVVNLYSISASPKIYDTEKVQEILKETNKVHVLPPVLDGISFVPKHQVRFSWNPEEVQDMLATSPKEVYEKWKSDILSEVESAIDDYKPNFPYKKNYMIRGTNLQRKSLVEKID